MSPYSKWPPFLIGFIILAIALSLYGLLKWAGVVG